MHITAGGGGGGAAAGGSEIGDVFIHTHIHENELAVILTADHAASCLAACDRLKNGRGQLQREGRRGVASESGGEGGSAERIRDGG